MSKSEKEVRAIIDQWADAIKNRDMDALDKIFSEDLIVTMSNGLTRGKAEELEVLKPKPKTETNIASVENRDLRVKIYGKTAVVTAHTEMQFATTQPTIPGVKFGARFRYTAVFVKQNGRWQIVALQIGFSPSPIAK